MSIQTRGYSSSRKQKPPSDGCSFGKLSEEKYIRLYNPINWKRPGNGWRKEFEKLYGPYREFDESIPDRPDQDDQDIDFRDLPELDYVPLDELSERPKKAAFGLRVQESPLSLLHPLTRNILFQSKQAVNRWQL